MKKYLPLLAFIFVHTGYLHAQLPTHHIAPSGNPMSCFIEARVLSIHPVETFHGQIKQPYKMRVKLSSVTHCGSSVPRALNPGDIVEIIFAGKKLLRKGDCFAANAEERLHLGHRPNIWVYDYELK